jgi:hypothetical protein
MIYLSVSDGGANMEKPRKQRRYFTQADYEAGLCDKNGLPIPQGPKEPPNVVKDTKEAKTPEPPKKTPTVKKEEAPKPEAKKE